MPAKPSAGPCRPPPTSGTHLGPWDPPQAWRRGLGCPLGAASWSPVHACVPIARLPPGREVPQAMLWGLLGHCRGGQREAGLADCGLWPAWAPVGDGQVWLGGDDVTVLLAPGPQPLPEGETEPGPREGTERTGGDLVPTVLAGVPRRWEGKPWPRGPGRVQVCPCGVGDQSGSRLPLRCGRLARLARRGRLRVPPLGWGHPDGAKGSSLPAPPPAGRDGLADALPREIVASVQRSSANQQPSWERPRTRAGGSALSGGD